MLPAFSVNAVYEQLNQLQHYKRWVIAFSGGVDSSVLLHLLTAYREQEQSCPDIILLHVNHGISPYADEWQAQCEARAKQYGVNFHCEKVTNLDKNTSESQLRSARYQRFESFLQPGDCLLLGHHGDDQAETVLLRALRGGGAAGLASIPKHRSIGPAELYRPLLSVFRADIEAYARQHSLQWIEDASNADISIQRNFIRHEILPRLANVWPKTKQSLLQLSNKAKEEQSLLDELAEIDLAALCFREKGVSCLDLVGLQAMSNARQHNTIRYWAFKKIGTRPNQGQLAEIQTLIACAEDAQPIVQFNRWQFRRFRSRLYLLLSDAVSEKPMESLHWADVSQSIQLPVGGELRLLEAVDFSNGLDIRWQAPQRCKPQGRAHSQQFKKLLQEYGVPPWERKILPLIYQGEQLLAVADYWQCDGVNLGQIEWQRAF